MRSLNWLFSSCGVLLLHLAVSCSASSEILSNGSNDEQSTLSRQKAAQAVHATQPLKPIMSRKRFPETDNPQVCIAFLSCCGRTDLLNHTIAGAIRHLEEDEPEGFRYEIAWVDNGSGTAKTDFIEQSYQIDYALPLPKNMGLAYGINLLTNNLCTAPYVLLLEEDWLYMDDIVADQTEQRKRAISTAIALVKTKLVSDDGRQVMGAFLRPERYHEFLKKPNIGDWQSKDVDLSTVLAIDTCEEIDHTCNSSEHDESEVPPSKHYVVPVDYQIFCGEQDLNKITEAWGSYSNGAGLYSRKALKDIGRLYGEPGDTFNFRYAESNYAFRALQKYCHLSIRLDYDGPNASDCVEIGGGRCSAAFHHIGGGRGTFPMDKASAKCIGLEWMLYNVPKYDSLRRKLEEEDLDGRKCTLDEVREFTNSQNEDSIAHRERVEAKNKLAFKMEKEKRDTLRHQAKIIRHAKPEYVRLKNPFLADKTDKELLEYADRMEATANSPHPLGGFWDLHGHPLVRDQAAS